MDRQTEKSPEECLLCGKCMEVCPVFKATDREELSPRGKAYLLRKFKEFDIDIKDTAQLAKLCAGCKKCLQACPQGLNLPLEIARLKSKHPDWKSWILSRIINSGSGILPAAKKVSYIMPDSNPFLKNSLKPKAHINPLLIARGNEEAKDQKAVIFPGCMGQHLRPELGEKAVNLLKLSGYQVLDTPDWKCCGYPLGAAGLFDQEKNEALKNLDLWNKLKRPLIFVFCATCLDGLTGSFGNPTYPEDMDMFRQNIFPLLPKVSKLDFELSTPLSDTDIFWHEPCHGTGKSGEIFKDIMSKFKVKLTISKTKCCGMGGSFAIQNPDISSLIADDFWKNISSSNPLVLTDCNGCVLQLDATAPGNATAAHWLEVIQPAQT
ncbi:MAG: (Fe-S)-binding protein [Desulfonatronovibrio sp.]